VPSPYKARTSGTLAHKFVKFPVLAERLRPGVFCVAVAAHFGKITVLSLIGVLRFRQTTQVGPDGG
jgi:hypothetical protein